MGTLMQFGLALILMATLAYVYQQFATRRDTQQYPYAGNIYQVGQQQIHLHCAGSSTEAQPTIVLEAGHLTHSMVWHNVIAGAANAYHICAYDRPGLGWSEPSQQTLSSAEITILLHDLLETAQIPPPYVLAGYDIGGLLATDYAQAYPNDVAGLILIDTSLGNERLSNPDDHMTDLELMLLQLNQPLFSAFGQLGGFRGYHQLQHWLNNVSLSASEQQWLSRRHTSHFGRTLVDETLLSERMLSRGVSAESFGQLPVYLIEKSATQREAQLHHLLESSTQSRLFQSSGSGYHLPYDDPDIVISVIQELLSVMEQK